jgi:hypothetical protein
VAPLRDQGCAKERSLRSTNAPTASTHIVFENRAADPVRVYWIDTVGKREPYSRLKPGESVTQQTYDTEPWVVTDATGRCLAVYAAGPETARAVYSGA